MASFALNAGLGGMSPNVGCKGNGVLRAASALAAKVTAA